MKRYSLIWVVWFFSEISLAGCGIRNEMLENKTPAEVLAHFSGWETRCPKSGLVAYYRASAKYEMGDLMGAIRTLEPVVVSNDFDDRFPALYLYAGLIFEAGDSAQARKILLDLHSIDPSHHGVIAMLARAGLAERKFDEAHKYALQAIDRNWNIAAMYTIAISALFELEDFGGVLRLYSKAKAQGLRNEEIFFQADIGARVAISYIKLGDKPRAASIFLILFELHPEFKGRKVIVDYTKMLEREGYL